jgi:hypothetical protein
VAPTELEGWLVRQPTVKECCVVSIPSDTAGEIPLAFIVRTDSTKDQSEKEVRDAINQGFEGNFADYKRLAGGIEFIDGFPKSQSGKVLRGQMKQKAREVVEERKKRLRRRPGCGRLSSPTTRTMSRTWRRRRRRSSRLSFQTLTTMKMTEHKTRINVISIQALFSCLLCFSHSPATGTLTAMDELAYRRCTGLGFTLGVCVA